VQQFLAKPANNAKHWRTVADCRKDILQRFDFFQKLLGRMGHLHYSVPLLVVALEPASDFVWCKNEVKVHQPMDLRHLPPLTRTRCPQSLGLQIPSQSADALVLRLSQKRLV
jgi:hypothetical protein